MAPFVDGFSKFSKEDKIRWLSEHYLNGEKDVALLKKYWHPEKKVQEVHDAFVENPVSNFYLPFAVAPNFLINGEDFAVPMVIEESSVVAAAAKGAKFWYPFGGFHTRVLSTVKTGHIHLLFYGEADNLKKFFEERKNLYLQRLKPFTENMERRGGGILSVELQDWRAKMENYYVIQFRFDTADSMGANFINTILEEWAGYMKEDYSRYGNPGDLEIIMAILSNYNPESVVQAEVRASVEKLQVGMDPRKYVDKFITAVEIARINPYRAVTHNKGIMNGVDAVVLATGNDFRAVEAGAHAYASRDGQYRSLSYSYLDKDQWIFGLKIPLALGVVGGVTKTHPLAGVALKLLKNPSARKLMEIVAAVGLAQNFSAVHSLITEGIQKGHMRMHLNNILLQMDATEEERKMLTAYFQDKKVHVHAVKEQLNRIRKKHKS